MHASTSAIYTLSLHDALPIWVLALRAVQGDHADPAFDAPDEMLGLDHDPTSIDRKSTRLNSSHDQISYAVFCLKKKKNHAGFLMGLCSTGDVPVLAL